MAHPDLGRFIRNDFDNIYSGANVWRWHIEGQHQLLHHVAGGDTSSPSLWQRVLVYIRNAPPDHSPLPPGDVDFIMGGQILATPTDWARVETHDGTWTYYFGGQAENYDRGWQWDRGMRVRKDHYENGVAITISYDDVLRADGDYNDYIIEANVLWIGGAQAGSAPTGIHREHGAHYGV